MKIYKITILFFLVLLTLTVSPEVINAKGGIYASGGGQHLVDEEFIVDVVVRGDAFNSFEGKLLVSGDVEIVEFKSTFNDELLWLKEPAVNEDFRGVFLGTTKTEYKMATIKLKGDKVGTGRVSIDDVKIANAGEYVGEVSTDTDFLIVEEIIEAPENLPLPEKVKVTSPTHPDSDKKYEQTTIEIKWNKDKNITGFSYILDQKEGTVPAEKITSDLTKVSFKDLANGTHYFHIRAKNLAGWGETTHFKFSIDKQEGEKPPEDQPEADKDQSRVEKFEEGVTEGVGSLLGMDEEEIKESKRLPMLVHLLTIVVVASVLFSGGFVVYRLFKKKNAPQINSDLP